MNCPACGRALARIEAGGVTVDACKGGCGGVWFDNRELQKFDEPHEAQGEVLLEIERADSVQADPEQKRDCPQCDGVVMFKRFCSVRHEVEVDECASCGGIWLDAGELRRIRGQFAGEEDQRKAAGEYFAEVFGPELSAEKAKNDAERQRVRTIANIFRFICPSYYIPGKQKWGAF